ncbi:MAG: hypothetical protein KBE91_03285 [Bacteroidia bacterium]|nr:hypothetical protein [Bacteroidia bacterium]MBP9688607.1 hypothetical protein [Bacteroidia bacterium]
MSQTVNIIIKGYSNLLNQEVAEQIEYRIKQSSCWVLEKHTIDNGMNFKIKAFADKLEKLYNNLQEAGLTLAEGSEEKILNAAQQYSVFRDIEITLELNLVVAAV